MSRIVCKMSHSLHHIFLRNVYNAWHLVAKGKPFSQMLWILCYNIPHVQIIGRYHGISFPAMMTSSNGNIFRVTGQLCREFHRSPVNSLHKGQWHGALMFPLICVWIIGWVNNREVGDLRRYHTNYDVVVMRTSHTTLCLLAWLHPNGMSDPLQILQIYW